ncbi:MAG: epoxyqueuosine reductase QueH [Lachnospiraceae bacterium]|nr:epoxyqueuosine reductase QueH [Lachnospiraceae bacterium]MBR1599609.1 epoxyqueuosine reductase QueH [Lachnospiraceae bacterium]
MDSNINFQLKMDKKIEEIIKSREKGDDLPSLLLHGCCAPCSSYVLEYLNSYFNITSFYYNPNISEETEYRKRVSELERLIKELPVENQVELLEGSYIPAEFDDAVKGLETLGERSRRCYACYELRLKETARVAADKGFDYFTTTLSISPYKNARWLNEIGERFSKEYGVEYLYADFKKRNGYKRSIELSEQYHLYRQDYCGCRYSKEESERKKANKNVDI